MGEKGWGEKGGAKRLEREIDSQGKREGGGTTFCTNTHYVIIILHTFSYFLSTFYKKKSTVYQ